MKVNCNDTADYWENRLSQYYGLHGTGFLGLGTNYNNWMYKIRRQVLTREVKTLGINLSEASVLDVGCGTGFYVDLWKQLGCRKLAGIDITNTAIEKMRIRYPEYQFFKGNIGDNLDNSPELLAGKYQLVSAFDVLFHIVDDEQYKMAFKNIYDMMEKGGTLMISENFVHTTAIRSSFQTSRSANEIVNIIMKTGFKIVRRSPFFVIMNAPIDTKNNFLQTSWKMITKTVKKSEYIGNIVGAVLYPLESVLIQLLARGPSTELMICVKE
jgi:2-polyprenyl-3-methyl-5-hydroxy-6-metoxy-1,4-benzoquinol methylase